MPDVELGVGDFDIQGREGFQVCILRCQRRGFADDEVRLQADAVDFDAPGFERFDEVQRGGSFGAGAFDVVVVVVELYGGVGGGGGLEGDGDVFGADGVVKDVGAVGTVVIEGFVCGVPGVAFAFVLGHFIGDVVFESGNQSFVCPYTRSDYHVLALLIEFAN